MAREEAARAVVTEKMGSVAVEMEVVETAEAKTAVAVRVEEGGGEGGGGDGGGDGVGGEGGGDGEVPGTETTAVYTTTQPNARKARTRMLARPFGQRGGATGWNTCRVAALQGSKMVTIHSLRSRDIKSPGRVDTNSAVSPLGRPALV